MKRLLLASIAIIVIGGCNVQNVDATQPVVVATKFYGALAADDEKTALAPFSPEFKAQVDNWPEFLGRMQASFGHVTSATLQNSSLAATDDGPCYSLTYAVKRAALASNEFLFLCAKNGSTEWLIRGHRVTRLDTGEVISAGVLPNEMGSTPSLGP